MWPPLARHLICPLHERMLGRRTFAHRRALERSQWLSPNDLRALQMRKLGSLLVHAAQHTKFYREWFAAAGVDPGAQHPLEELQKLPTITKLDITKHLEDMVWRDAPGGLTRCSTGGSTGEPLIFYLGRRRQAFDQAARMRTHQWFGVDVGDRELYLWGSPIEWTRRDRVKRFRDRLFNHRLCSAFDMSPERMDAYLCQIERFDPACLFGYPSSIALLVDHALSRGRRLRCPSLRAVFVTGEVCFDHDRKAIADYFGVPVADCYGSREAGFIAHQCPVGNYHLTAESVVVEIFADDVPAKPGRTGEIVVTHLDAYAHPFIRYRTGDLGRLAPGRCACGRGLPMMDIVQGRTTDCLHFPDGTVKHALCVIYPLRELVGMRRFKVVQQADYSVVIHVETNGAANDPSIQTIARSVRTAIGAGVSIDVRKVKRIESPHSGKHRYVVSHVEPNQARAREEVIRV